MSVEPEILSAEEKQETTAVAVVLTEAQAIVVEDQETMGKANDFFLRLREARKKIEAVFAPHIERAKAAKNAAEAMRKGIVEEQERALSPILQAEGIVKKEIQLYLEVQREIREKQERAAREQARKDEENRRLALAVEAEAAGQSKLAEAVLERPMVPPPAVMLPKAEDALKGATVVSTWKYEVYDFRALVEACLAGTVPMEAIQPNDKAIGSWVRTAKDKFNWAGVRVQEVQNLRPTGR
jgi:hypothetical protein